ncbi:MAG: NAD(P)/FAD-dependent oxidoreductase [Bacillota bacterium]
MFFLLFSIVWQEKDGVASNLLFIYSQFSKFNVLCKEGCKIANRFVIIGNSAAGIAAAETLRHLEPGAPITVVTEENHPPYSRCRITEVIARRAGLADIGYRSPSFYTGKGIELRQGARVVALEPANRRVILDTQEVMPYDRLLLATGARPAPAGVPGEELAGVFTLRSYDQARAIAQAADQARHAVVVGGGLVGLKAAIALRQRNLRVTVVVKSSHILMRQLDEESAALVEGELTAAGIDFIYGQNPAACSARPGTNAIESVVLENGREIAANLVLVAKGVRPNSELLRAAGGETGAGIKISRYMETSLPGVYAAGDCVEVTDLVSGRPAPSALWTLAVEQGRYAACNMAGRRKAYPSPLTRLNSAQFGRIPFIAAGSLEDGEEFIVRRQAGGIYQKLALQRDRLVGYILTGCLTGAGVYTALIKAQRPLGGLRSELLKGTLSAADLLFNPA